MEKASVKFAFFVALLLIASCNSRHAISLNLLIFKILSGEDCFMENSTHYLLV
jgi:hypothetical protein